MGGTLVRGVLQTWPQEEIFTGLAELRAPVHAEGDARPWAGRRRHLAAVPLPTAPGCCAWRGRGVRRKRKERGGSFARGSLRTCATQKQGFWNHWPERESWCCPTTHPPSRLPSPSLWCPVWDTRERGNHPRRGITARMHANTCPTPGTCSAFNVAP